MCMAKKHIVPYNLYSGLIPFYSNLTMLDDSMQRLVSEFFSEARKRSIKQFYPCLAGISEINCARADSFARGHIYHIFW